ncbi:hypothetical protein [Pseudomonas sp. TMP9]|uniref:hypothetical protein n=1 Tax=unclassified Pseudomonas TaxID=196821 RepID=UPI0030CAF661
MADHHAQHPFYARRAYRVITGMLGLLFAGVGVYVMTLAVVDLPLRVGVGLVIVLLGANMLWAAIQAKASWLSKLGPLP